MELLTYTFKAIVAVFVAVWLIIGAFWPVNDKPTTTAWKLSHLAGLVVFEYWWLFL